EPLEIFRPSWIDRPSRALPREGVAGAHDMTACAAPGKLRDAARADLIGAGKHQPGPRLSSRALARRPPRARLPLDVVQAGALVGADTIDPPRAQRHATDAHEDPTRPDPTADVPPRTDRPHRVAAPR